MKQVHLGIYILILCLFLVGCNDTNAVDSINEKNDDGISKEKKSETKQLDRMDIYDFYYINRAPAATIIHPLDELIKIYFSTKSVAIDVGNNELYEKPRFATNGVTIFEEPLLFNDKEGLIEILDKYRVQEWKEDYTTEEPTTYEDGYGWMMLLQFEDGTVERYQGSGPYKEEVIPNNFDDFANEVEVFKKEKVKDGSE